MSVGAVAKKLPLDGKKNLVNYCAYAIIQVSKGNGVKVEDKKQHEYTKT